VACCIAAQEESFTKVSVLPCVAVCCSVVQSVAEWCSMVHCCAMCISNATGVLHRGTCVALWCSVVQRGVLWCTVVQWTVVNCSVVQCVTCGAVCNSMLQCSAKWCSVWSQHKQGSFTDVYVLQRAAVCCSALQIVVTVLYSQKGLFSALHHTYPWDHQVDRKNPPPPGGFPIYCVPSLRTVCKRTPLEEPGTNLSRGVLLHTVLDEGT